MPTFVFQTMSAQSDPWNIGPRIMGPRLAVEADEYRVDPGYITFLRDGKPYVSIPNSKVGAVDTLDEDGTSGIKMLDE